MLRMFKEHYEIDLSRLASAMRTPSRPNLSNEDLKECKERARDAVCKIGVAKNQFGDWLNKRYGKTIESGAIDDAVELGAKQGWLTWGPPHRLNPLTGAERKNVILTEEGFTYIQEQEFLRAVSLVHSAYMLEPRRR